MSDTRKDPEISGADQFDPLHPKRQFSWKIFLVAGAVIVGYFLLREEFSDISYGLAMALCGVVAIGIAAPNAFSSSWFSESMPGVKKVFDKTIDGDHDH